ncbi:MAG: VWA domain-containing protein [Planctomycetota bacterium]
MFLDLFFDLRAAGVPVTIGEYFALAGAMEKGVAEYDVERFYYLARASLCADERRLDRFDRVFAAWFERMEAIEDPFQAVPPEWLERMGERFFTEEEKAKIREMGGFRELLETLRKRLEEQGERHEGGSKWIGTGGTSPYGAYGYNPAGIRIGQSGSRHRRAVKVWDRREFRDFDGDVELGTRQMKLALRRLRKFTREGAADELDLDATIERTARNAGYLDLAHRPERKNRVRVLLLLDVGGSMDDHVGIVEQLFSAARSEFSALETFYFHNCPYERVWRTNGRRRGGMLDTYELMRTYGPDHRVVLVGDASMGMYEITEPGGSVEHWNEESGQTWMARLLRRYERAAWINPVRDDFWDYTGSIDLIRRLMGGRMYPLSLSGLEAATAELRS